MTIKKLLMSLFFLFFSLNLFSKNDKNTFCETGFQMVCGSLNTSQTIWGSIYYPSTRTLFKACIDEKSLNELREGIKYCESSYAYSSDNIDNIKIVPPKEEKKIEANIHKNSGLFRPAPVTVDFGNKLIPNMGSLPASCKRMADKMNAKESYKSKVWASHNSSNKGSMLACPNFGNNGGGAGYASGIRQAQKIRKQELKEEQARIEAIDKAIKEGKYDPDRRYYVVTKIKIGNYAAKTFEIKDPKKQNEEPFNISLNKNYIITLVSDKSQTEECNRFFSRGNELSHTYLTISTIEKDPSDGIEKKMTRSIIPILDEPNLGQFCNTESFDSYEISMDSEGKTDVYPEKNTTPVKYLITSINNIITNVDKIKLLDKRNYLIPLKYNYLSDNISDIGSFTPIDPDNFVGTFIWDSSKKSAKLLSSKEKKTNRDKI